MAIYRLEAKIFGRQAKGADGTVITGKRLSVVAKAAYRSGDRLKDEQIDQSFDYRSRSQEVVYKEILAGKDAPDWLQGDDSREKRERLWNEVEKAEKRKDSQLAREFILSLPVELDREAQIELARSWCEAELVSKGFVVDVSIHRSKDGQNPHAHVMATLRPIDQSGFGPKPSTEGKFNGRGSVGKGAKSDLELWRETWATARIGRSKPLIVPLVSIIGRSQIRESTAGPEPKIGVAAVNMQRTGKVCDPDKVREARRVRIWNSVLPAIRDVERLGAVKQEGLGGKWWERMAIMAGKAYDKAWEMAKDVSSGGRGWADYIEERRRQERGREPEFPGD